MKHAARALWKTPGFTLVVIVTLGLGIGANTAIFSLMDQVLVRTLAVREPDRVSARPCSASIPTCPFST